MMKSIRIRLGQFAKDTGGNVSVEFILAMPFVFWAFMGVYVFFDGYRQSAVNLKAAYTVSDLLSRETNPINNTYIDNMHQMLKLLTRSQSQVHARISVIRWDQQDDRYYVDWSANRGFPMEHTDATVIEIAERLPVMPDNERVILVETQNVFVPLFKVGMSNKNLDNFVFSRPRFAPQLVFDDNDPGPDNPHDDDDTADPGESS